MKNYSIIVNDAEDSNIIYINTIIEAESLQEAYKVTDKLISRAWIDGTIPQSTESLHSLTRLVRE